ncbi:hypothetical protein [Thalassotalea sp. PP2-459]|uniref:hypothetical protein n=1 Tax=Thalassotalea sp. PP2-459 TaxID=1742724 RepID=UPI000942FAB6|nr:hypothetical protein [Thalassotalea sp. PP2-459]OKY25396.1 hypothetical protein BI291_16115 [Thalassotalea sp. PP2-459]
MPCKNYLKDVALLIPLLIFLSACGTIHTGFDPLDAIYSGTAAVIKGKGASENCEQGHVQDRVNCREKKDVQVEALKKSLKKNSGK